MKLMDAVANKQPTKNGMHMVLPPFALRLIPEVDLSKMWFYNHDREPVHTGTIINRIIDKWQSLANGGTVKIKEAYLSRKHLTLLNPKKRIINLEKAALAETNLSNLAVGRMIIKIALTGLSDDLHPTIAINITPSGVQMAFGQDITVCSNFTIFGAAEKRATWIKEDTAGGAGKKRKPTVGELASWLEQYMEQVDDYLRQHENQIKAWQEQPVTKAGFDRLIGQQFQKISVLNHARTNKTLHKLGPEQKTLAINGVQLGLIAYEASHPSHDLYAWRDDAVSK